MQIKEEVEGDFSEYQVGTVTYTGDLFKLPEEDGQSIYSEYDGCVYELVSEQDIWEEKGSGALIHSDTLIPLYAYFMELITQMEPVKGIECYGRPA